jgi:hypothetical protein
MQPPMHAPHARAHARAQRCIIRHARVGPQRRTATQRTFIGACSRTIACTNLSKTSCGKPRWARANPVPAQMWAGVSPVPLQLPAQMWARAPTSNGRMCTSGRTRHGRPSTAAYALTPLRTHARAWKLRLARTPARFCRAAYPSSTLSCPCQRTVRVRPSSRRCGILNECVRACACRQYLALRQREELRQQRLDLFELREIQR